MDSIDAVIARLDDIITDSIARQDRRGYFAALYNRVTLRVRDGIARGEFSDGELMQRFDVAFARRYLDAYDAHQAGGTPAGAWRQSFAAARADGIDVLQHLLLGMNAHIHLDLGVAAAAVCPGAALPSLRDDFYQINDILASLVSTVVREVEEVDGEERPVLGAVLSAIDHVGGRLERATVDFFLDEARASAWRFAEELAALPPDGVAAVIARRDAHTVLIGHGVLALRPVATVLAAGDEDVATTIRVLARGENY